MPVVKSRSVLSGMLVKEAMRRQMLQLPEKAAVDHAIQQLIKFKVNALLIVDALRRPVGVVSKTDVVAAFYGGLSLDTQLRDVMNGPVATCFPDEALEAALDRMRKGGIHQLYVQGAEEGSLTGALSYEDAVAVLYRYCRACPRRVGGSREPEGAADALVPLTVEEAMTRSVMFCGEADSLAQVAEGLTSHRLGAVLIQKADGRAAGVVSKTDLVMAYRHGIGLEAEARSIMNDPVVCCGRDAFLADALRQMLLKDVQRLFVHGGDDPSRMVGVLSLSDAARMRSGTCRACVSSRIMSIK